MPELQLNILGYPMLPGLGQECSRRFCHRMFENGGTCGTKDGLTWVCCYECDKAVSDQRFREAEQEKKRDEDARKLELEAQEAERKRIQEQRRLDAEQKQALEKQRLLEAAARKQQEEELAEQQRLAAASAAALETAEELHARMLKDKADADAAAAVVKNMLKEWAETFCVGRLVKLTKKGPHQNRFALVIARPSDDGTLRVRLFQENVGCLLACFGCRISESSAGGSRCLGPA